MLGNARGAIQKGDQYLAENKKNITKEEKKELKGQISLLQRQIRGKKPEKLTRQEIEEIVAQTEKLEGMLSSHS